MSSLTLTARWLFPVDRAPFDRGTVRIEGDRITAVDPAGTMSADIDLGNVAILPGLVNAHTHLDLSDAVGLYPPTADFTGWLRQVIQHRRSQTPEQIDDAVQCGLRDSLRFGVTALGDISAQGASWDALLTAPLDAVVYFEAIGLSSDRAAAATERVRNWCASGSLDSGKVGAHCQPAISPHAPYTVGRELLKNLVPLQQNRYPFAIHLGETREELDLITQRKGPFVDFLKELGVYNPDALTTDVARWLACSPMPSTLIHGNYLDPKQVAASKPRAVVYCPRTHAAFGHEPYPLREYLAHGVTIALGSDSLASNPDLNILAEARMVHEHFPDIPGDILLRMLTINGIHALGPNLPNSGTLTAGHPATLVVLPLPDRDDADPHRLVFESSQNVSKAMVRGRWREEMTNVERPKDQRMTKHQ